MGIFLVFLAIESIYSEQIYSLNCGGEEYIDSQGVIWSSDKYFEGGSSFTQSDLKYIRFTDDPYIYLSERQHPDSFNYNIPVLRSGHYVIILKYLDIFNTQNKRITNFFIGSKHVQGDVSVFEGLKDSAAINEYIEIFVNESGLYFNNSVIPNAVKQNSLSFSFRRNDLDFARVSGIVVFSGTLNQTDHHDYTEKVKKFKRLVKNKQEMSEKPLQFPKDHQLLTSVSLYSVIFKYPFSIIFSSIAFYLLLSKVINR